VTGVPHGPSDGPSEDLAPWAGRWPLLPESVLSAIRLIGDLRNGGTATCRPDEAAAALLTALHSAGGRTLPGVCVQRLLQDDTHPYIQCLDRGEEPGASLRALLRSDLQQLQFVAQLPWIDWVRSAGVRWVDSEGAPALQGTSADVASPWSSQMARQQLETVLGQGGDWGEALEDLSRFWRHYGCGLHQGVAAYRLGVSDRVGAPEGHTQLLPIRDFDHFPLEWLQFSGGRADLLEQNTLALLEGDEASNALIWGPRGCGKSTLIRSLVGRYWERGLRAIEIPAASYLHLPSLFELVRNRREYFIAVLDNIAVEPQDPAHRTLATMLDGGLEQTPPNLIFYATSNYKDLVDRHGERPDGPPPQQADAARAGEGGGATEPVLAAYDPQGLQRLDERRALDDRFALKIFIDLPTKSQYEQIVLAYAERAGLGDCEERVLADFRVWCMRHNHDLIGGRTARDYIRHRVASVQREATDSVRQTQTPRAPH
jgi:predicted AAA+ superfamily ATPase